MVLVSGIGKSKAISLSATYAALRIHIKESKNPGQKFPCVTSGFGIAFTGLNVFCASSESVPN